MSVARLVAAFAATLLLSGCYFYIADIAVRGSEPTPPFTREDQERVKATVIEIARSAGLWETDTAAKLASMPSSSSPYREFVSAGAPGGSPERRHVSILGQMREDRREIYIGVRDSERGEPLPETAKLIEDLRIALEHALPGRRVEVTHRTKHRLFGP